MVSRIAKNSGDELRLDEIGSLLGITPTKSRLKGEPKSPGAKQVWGRSLWLLRRFELSDDRDPVEHLNWLLNLLEPKALVIKDISGRLTLISSAASLPKVDRADSRLM